MSKRAQHRARYIEGWNSMDAGKLLSSTTENFVFDDPADPAPITKVDLVRYMPVWVERAQRLGGTFEFDITDKVVMDEAGILLEWYWWQLTGIDVIGSAIIKTSDEGVFSERITYYRTPWPLRA
ncbi:MAG: hypothetical protein VCD50_17405 [Alphaproteobacteria bacterium]